MAKHKKYDDDDGRTIADMSDVGRQPLIVPRYTKQEQQAQPEEQSERPPWEDDSLNKKERGAFIGGALAATLAIASVFAVGFAIAILVISFIGR